MTRPLIGLGGRRVLGSAFKECPVPLLNKEGDFYWVDYADAIVEAGGIPVLIPQNVPISDLVDRLDGLLVPGGTDIDPKRYDEDPHPALLPVEPARDEFEMDLLDAAIARELPTLGICRGIQLLNVHAGGSLHQHVPEHTHMDVPGNTEQHAVEFADGSVLHQLYGSSRRVNSLHHQAIDRLGDGMIATAISDDGLVEGIEHTDLALMAVQWHPEMLDTRASDPLFRWLVGEASARNAR